MANNLGTAGLDELSYNLALVLRFKGILKWYKFMVPKIPVNHSVVVKTKLSGIVEISSSLVSKLEVYDFSEEDIFAVRLALQEAFLNAIMHGNRMDSKKKVKIDCLVEPERVEISMIDEGEGFDPNAVPDPRYGENLYKPNGRGLFLMRSYMDLVEFNEQGNRVRMVRYREKPPLRKSQAQA